MSLPAKPVSSRADVSAESLIQGEPDIFPASPGLIVLRDDQSTAPEATRRFSEHLASAIASIGSDAGLASASYYRRLPDAWEAAILLVLVVLLGIVSGLPQFRRNLGFGVLAAVCLASQWLAVGLAQVWLPGIPLLAAILAAFLVRFLFGVEETATRPLPETPAPMVPQPVARQVIPVTSRTFRSVTIWKEPASVQVLPEAPPVVAKVVKAARKTAPRKDAASLSETGEIAPPKPAAKKAAAKKTTAKKAVAKKESSNKSASSETPPDPES